ncbi:MAG: ferredoxin family protein [Methylococcaceae bacterium]|nr:ferredoxin family protein [Methylococcaceae bacterium]
MTYVVTENCIKCKFTDCVDVCPVSCFHEGPYYLVINPVECIDCSLCQPECPTNAIYPEADVPQGQEIFLELNAKFSKEWPLIIQKQSPFPDADDWNGKEGKLNILDRNFLMFMQVGLTDSEAGNKTLSVRYIPELTEFQIEDALNDQDYSVRVAIINRRQFKLTPSQVERCLIDKNPDVRIAIASRTDIKLTPAQIERGITDEELKVKMAFLNRGDFIFTTEQFEHGLKSDFHEVGSFFTGLLRNSAQKIIQKYALNHSDNNIRNLAVKYYPERLSSEQIACGLADPDYSVRIAYLERDECEVTSKQLDDSLKTGSPELIVSCLSKFNNLNDAQLEKAFSSKFYEVRRQLISNEKISLNPTLIERALADKNVSVRLAVIARKDFKPTQEQLKIGLTDKSYKVRTEFLRFTDRSDLTDKINSIFANQNDIISDLEFTSQFLNKVLANFDVLNKKLKHPLQTDALLTCIRRAAELGSGACILIQGNTGDCWSNPVIPVIFIVNFGDVIRIRMRTSKPYRKFSVTPAIWPELRGFPMGKCDEKVLNWAAAGDVDVIQVKDALVLPKKKCDCHKEEWSI